VTGLENQNHETADALSIRAKASDWLIARRMSQGWSEKDQAAFDLWLAQSPANLLAYWRLDAAWNQAQRLTALRRPERAPDDTAKPRNMFRVIGITAALILVAVLGIGGAVYLRQPASKMYATPVGGHLAIALTDGSKIELNTDTVLRLSDTANRRQATLEKGEAYFQIRHDGLHPFALAVNGHRVIDLGTKFSVREEPDRVEVMLIEGSARIESESAAAPPAVLRPGDFAIATANSLSVSKKPVPELGDRLAWRRGMLSFKYATLGEAANEFNRYNSTKIVIADAHVSRLTIYGTFPAKDVATFADAAQNYFKLHVETRGDEVVISR
jgi:transmembrane sensor